MGMGVRVETASGWIEGRVEGDVAVFRGVPFGVVPQRFAPSRPPEPWAGTRSAETFGPWAPQNGGDVLFQLKPHAQDEDCLKLNVWTPAADAARRPVLVWIHGGGFTNGSGASPVFDGSRLADEGDVVVVTISYRLGALGFLRLVEWTGGRIPATGNEGLEDQVLALRWVAENIDRFGGDPANVTLFGESAGGMSVGCHLSMPASAPLFHKAIAQSGACHGAAEIERAKTLARLTLEALDGLDVERPLDAPLSARQVAALRRAPVEQILAAQAEVQLRRARVAGLSGMAYAPVLDGKTLERHPLERVHAGSASDKPLIVGTTLEEWRMFAYVRPSELAMSEPRLRKRLERWVGAEHTDSMLEVYRRSLAARGGSCKAFDLWCAIQTDRVFRAPARKLAEAQGQHSDRVFMYCLEWRSVLGRLGACHALDLGLVFGTHGMPGSQRLYGTGPDVERISADVRAAWTQFAHTGSPDGWAPYASRRATRMLGADPRNAYDPESEQRVAWEPFDTAIGEL